MARRKSRILAFQALYAWDAGAADTERLLDFSWASDDRLERMGEDGKAFARLIISGTLENIKQIDEIISSRLVNWEIGRLNKVDLAILRMSVYSLLFQKDIHPSIIIDEAVDISREYGCDDAYRFINGILGAIEPGLKKEA
ncbi:transcription antitermination factor NusB [Treponema sp. HNW]|uniref:transcription antitermination factor NusB n=1 Tax=Treponema sp. HNW TaxID=3116654 RepID=UPI003D0CD3C4